MINSQIHSATPEAAREDARGKTREGRRGSDAPVKSQTNHSQLCGKLLILLLSLLLSLNPVLKQVISLRWRSLFQDRHAQKPEVGRVAKNCTVSKCN